MQITLTAEQEAQLSQLAAQEGKGAEDLARELFTRYLAEEARFIAAVKLGEAALQHGEYLTHEQVGERLDHLFESSSRIRA